MEQSFGPAIKKFRREMGLQQKYVALSSGLGKPRYNKIENGDAPTDREITKIAVAMETDRPTLIDYWCGLERRKLGVRARLGGL